MENALSVKKAHAPSDILKESNLQRVVEGSAARAQVRVKISLRRVLRNQPKVWVDRARPVQIGDEFVAEASVDLHFLPKSAYRGG